jgi:hypothetical protein
MKKQFQKIGFALILLTVGLSSCINLKYVNVFSSSSLQSIQKFEEINYSFKQNCLDNCLDKKINNLDLDVKDCDCGLNERADSVTLLIYNSIRGYFDGLTSLSDNDLTSCKMDALTKSLTEGDFGSIEIGKEQAVAFSKISKILLKAFTNDYRKKKIKEYVEEANEPLKVLISFLDFNLSGNLKGKLNVQKQRIEINYFDLTKDATLSTFEKRKAVEEYYSRLSAIEEKQTELVTYSKALKKIAEGHQKLADNIETFSKKEIKDLLTQYASDIQDILSEFNKLKK